MKPTESAQLQRITDDLRNAFGPSVPLPEPVPPGRLERLTDHIESESWPEILALSFLIVCIGMALGWLLAG